jgi:hypothetical protein
MTAQLLLAALGHASPGAAVADAAALAATVAWLEDTKVRALPLDARAPLRDAAAGAAWEAAFAQVRPPAAGCSGKALDVLGLRCLACALALADPGAPWQYLAAVGCPVAPSARREAVTWLAGHAVGLEYADGAQRYAPPPADGDAAQGGSGDTAGADDTLTGGASPQHALAACARINAARDGGIFSLSGVACALRSCHADVACRVQWMMLRSGRTCGRAPRRCAAAARAGRTPAAARAARRLRWPQRRRSWRGWRRCLPTSGCAPPARPRLGAVPSLRTPACMRLAGARCRCRCCRCRRAGVIPHGLCGAAAGAGAPGGAAARVPRGAPSSAAVEGGRCARGGAGGHRRPAHRHQARPRGPLKTARCGAGAAVCRACSRDCAMRAPAEA